MPGKLKLGIIGTGAIGNVHAAAFAAAGQTDLTAACDIHAGRLAATSDKFGVADRFGDYRKLLATDAEAVIVAVPNALHKEIAIAALQAGKHVLLEKPMALNARQAADIVAASKRAKGILQIGMIWRQHPANAVVRDFVARGLMGDIYHMRAVMIRRRGIPGLGRWFTTMAESGGGPMIDLGVHWFDGAMWMSGLWKPTSVSAKTYAKFGPRMRKYCYVGMWAGPPDFRGVFDVEDYSTGFVRFGAKATMSFEIVWAANAESESFIEILGTDGGTRIDGGKPLVIHTEHNGRVTDISPQFDEKANKFELQARAFADACHGKRPPAATAEQGLTVMKLIDAIYASSKADKEVAIK
ncbi:MAG TPA: Gfo/Idh/MocA family oxidoreductase [Phycisphaerae bacterium]|nr:Gfo/Idh/MocA family oxidoreductase [Phycisphaerae bacterium]